MQIYTEPYAAPFRGLQFGPVFAETNDDWVRISCEYLRHRCLFQRVLRGGSQQSLLSMKHPHSCDFLRLHKSCLTIPIAFHHSWLPYPKILELFQGAKCTALQMVVMLILQPYVSYLDSWIMCFDPCLYHDEQNSWP